MEYVELVGFTICLYKYLLFLFACNILYVIVKNTLGIGYRFYFMQITNANVQGKQFLHLPWLDFTSIPSIFF